MESDAPPPNGNGADATLSAHLLRLALIQIRKTYATLNESLFSGQLKTPIFEWLHGQAKLGQWEPQARTISLSAALLSGPWGVLVEVLKHEMAHQFVFEVLDQGEAPAHGGVFSQVCEARGIDPRAVGLPTSHEGSASSEAARVLERIRRLLALASSENQNEAEAAMSAARKLMLKHNLDAPRSGRYSFRHLGAPTGRRKAWQRALANLLSEFFFVDIIIVPVYRPLEGKSGSVIEACGSESNLEVASYAYEFLEHAAETSWLDHKRARRVVGNRDRESYLLGVMTGFRDKLARENRQLKGQGLIWLGDPELENYFRKRHPHIRHVGGRAAPRKDAFASGREAGERLVLHRGISEGPSRNGVRLLTR